jgi:hypothetical protein
MADGKGFEPSKRFRLPVFKTGAFSHSATHPFIILGFSKKFINIEF